jgi:hypothetical protein
LANTRASNRDVRNLNTKILDFVNERCHNVASKRIKKKVRVNSVWCGYVAYERHLSTSAL